MTPEELKNIRKDVKMHRPEFCKRAGISPRMIAYYEDGEARIPKKVANSAHWVRHCYRMANLPKKGA